MSILTPFTPVVTRAIRVHWNLHTHLWSVSWSGRVQERTDRLVLTDLRLVIQPAGQRNARLRGVRNVHAFAVGTLAPDRTPLVTTRASHYNPFTHDTFTDGHGQPVTQAHAAHFHPGGFVHLEDKSPSLPGS